MEKVTWNRVRGVHYFDMGLFFMAYGVNPEKFKKKRHAKKYFKKYIQPLLKNEDIKSQWDSVVSDPIKDIKSFEKLILK